MQENKSTDSYAKANSYTNAESCSGNSGVYFLGIGFGGLCLYVKQFGWYRVDYGDAVAYVESHGTGGIPEKRLKFL